MSLKLTPTEAFTTLRCALEDMVEAHEEIKACAKGLLSDRGGADLQQRVSDVSKRWNDAANTATKAFKAFTEDYDVLDDIEGLLDTIYGGSAG